MRGALIRNIVRWVLLLFALAFAAYDAPQTWHNYTRWRLALLSDSVAAGFWRTAFYSDVREMAIALGAGIVLWIALRPRVKRVGNSDRGLGK
ncbi:MAG TPA: hypothetical protein VGR97_13895 [Candidatus Acidoferrales bacterium]|nr:hypothetical protein [Candidatus Acidoferrales bacterium]